MNGVPSMIPIATGRPGLIAIRHSTSVPTLSTPALTWSSSPVETPPVVRIRSWAPATCLQALRQRGAVVADDAEIADLAAKPRQHRDQHDAVGIEQLRRRARRSRRYQFVAGRKHRDADAPAHLEHASGRTRRRARHPAAAAAARPSSAAWPSGISSPAGRTLAPGFRPAGRTTLPASSRRTSSCMNTVSVPSGIGAPVKIRTAWPGLIGSRADAPA